MLFQGSEVGHATAPSEPRIRTPFGEMASYAVMASLDTLSTLPDEQRVLSSGAEWRSWSTGSARAELLVAPYSPHLPEGRVVLGCQAILWRLRALTHVTRPTFACQWGDLPADADGGPDSGEGLDALTWQLNSARLSLGTEDGEYLRARATKGSLMPARLATELNASTVHYLADGLSVPLPSLQPSELVQLHFIVAWTSPGGPDLADTWFAVDQPASTVLTQLAIR